MRSEALVRARGTSPRATFNVGSKLVARRSGLLAQGTPTSEVKAFPASFEQYLLHYNLCESGSPVEKSGRLSLGHSGAWKNGGTTGPLGAPATEATPSASPTISPLSSPRAEISAVVPHIDIVAEDNFDKAIREHEEIMQREHGEKTKDV